MYLSDSPIIRLSGAGFLNTVDDTYIGGAPAGSGDLGTSQYPGQLGKVADIDASMIAQMYDSTVGTLYPGSFQYVRLRSADAAPVVGQLAFWDTTVSNWMNAFQVTITETRSSVDAAVFIAGVFISIPTPGNYCYIQRLGIVDVKSRAVLTSAGAVGSQCYAAGAGGADMGLMDVVASANPADFADVGLLQTRYLGNAIEAPVAGTLTQVDLRFQNIIG